jgi:hypothetical protein
MTGPIIEKAKSFYDEMKITDKCTFSNGWQPNFKDCHGIGKLDVSGEVLSADEAAERYTELFHNLGEWHKLFPNRIYSGNETRFEMCALLGYYA